MPRCLAIAVLIALCLPCLAAVGEVYKCTDAHGGIAFQDHPCPAGAHETLMHLVNAPSAATQPTATTSAPTTVPAMPSLVAITKPLAPLPPLWICENADDGSRYFSRNGNPPVRYVPLGVLGYPGQSLAQAYGPGGIGVSAPGMRQIPIDRSPQAASAGDYTALQDHCLRASREQTCNYLRKQDDQVEHKLMHAFKDQQAILQPQADELQRELNGC